MHWILLLALSGCGWKGRVKHLSSVEFDHYYALRVYMSDDERKEYLKLKTEEERNKYLQDKGLWDRFYKYPDHVRELVVSGEVQPGWTKDMLYMAWGAPFDTRKLAGRQAVRSELLVYRFEESPEGAMLVWEEGSKTEYKAVRLFVREVTIDDDVIKTIEEKDASW